MGTWSVSITGNDTAQDLLSEYTAAFYKYEPKEAVQKIENYVRTNMFDESDEEEWCNYFYSLADFMWKKGILTDEIKEKTIRMIDSGFGLELWEEAGEKTLKKRQQVLSDFREKLTSPMPPKKKIRPNVHTERIFNNGDLIAIQLQTAGKPYTKNDEKPMSDDEFHAYDGKYILMQLIDCYSSWSSAIVPEVKDYWAYFKLYDGIYDTIPQVIKYDELKPAKIHQKAITSCFTCESNLFYFKRRKYQIIGNNPIEKVYDKISNASIFFGINRPWFNPDSEFLAAMGKDTVCGECKDIDDRVRKICHYAVRYGRFNYQLPRDENERRFAEEEYRVIADIESSVNEGGKLLSLQFGNRTIGIITIKGNRIDNLYVEGRFQNNGFGTQLLQYAILFVGKGAYIVVLKTNRVLTHICEGLEELERKEDFGAETRFIF